MASPEPDLWDDSVASWRPEAARRLEIPGPPATKSREPRWRKSGRAKKMKPLKRLERYLSAIFKLGRTEAMSKDAIRRLDQAGIRIDQIETQINALPQTMAQDLRRMEERLDDKAKAEHAALARALSDLTRRLDHLLLHRDQLASLDRAASEPVPDTTGTLPASEGFEAFKDRFYHMLENRYRGSEEAIARSVRIYLPDVEAAVLRCEGKPVMDIGCGRGEWLGVLQDAEIEAFGIDSNAVQMDGARQKGLDVRLGDAIAAMAEAGDNSLSVITAHHLIEHLPFETVAWITREALRVLAPGGLLLFETPNTRNVLVGATTFHTDPTHLKPMPEQVMSVLFDAAGFHPVEVRALNPHERFEEFRAKPDFNEELAFLMFGPQDMAILGLKPSGD